MKALAVCGSCLVLLIIVLVIVGSIIPKRHTASRSAMFRATPDRLYDLISGPQTWRPDVARSETFSDATGHELERETSRGGQTIVYQVANRVPPLSLTRRIASEDLPYSGTWTYSLQAQGNGTLVQITEDGEVSNPLFRFVSRFIIGYTRTMDQYLQALGNATGLRDPEIKN
jgi:hypothetical protein